MLRFLYICAEILVLYLLILSLGAGFIWLRGFDEVGQLIFLGYAVVSLFGAAKLVLIGDGRGDVWTGFYRPVRLLSMLIPIRQKPAAEWKEAERPRRTYDPSDLGGAAEPGAKQRHYDGKSWPAPSPGEEVKRTAYIAASGGVIGLTGWEFRREIGAGLGKYATDRAAIIAVVVSLATLWMTAHSSEAHRDAIVREGRYSFHVTKAYRWPHDDLRVAAPKEMAAIEFQKPAKKRRRLLPHVGFGDYFRHKATGFLRYIAMAALLLAPLAWMFGNSRRNWEAVWAEEYGRDTPAFREAMEARQRQTDERVGKDDWLLYPPWEKGRT